MVQRYDMAKEYSLDINVIPVEEHDGAYVKYEDYEKLEKKLKALAEAVYLAGYEPVSESMYRLAEDICND